MIGHEGTDGSLVLRIIDSEMMGDFFWLSFSGIDLDYLFLGDVLDGSVDSWVGRHENISHQFDINFINLAGSQGIVNSDVHSYCFPRTANIFYINVKNTVEFGLELNRTFRTAMASRRLLDWCAYISTYLPW